MSKINKNDNNMLGSTFVRRQLSRMFIESHCSWSMCNIAEAGFRGENEQNESSNKQLLSLFQQHHHTKFNKLNKLME